MSTLSRTSPSSWKATPNQSGSEAGIRTVRSLIVIARLLLLPFGSKVSESVAGSGRRR
jgi:hypothetical protein